MAANHSNTYILNANVETVCAVIKDTRFINFLSLKFKSEFPMQGGMMYKFSSGINLSSWGENIDITVLNANGNSSQVTIRSECAMPTQIIDWGKNKSNVEKIYNHLMTCMASNQNFNAEAYQPMINPNLNATYQPMNSQNPDTAQAQQVKTPNFCTKCGAKLNSGAKFCHKCGAQVF